MIDHKWKVVWKVINNVNIKQLKRMCVGRNIYELVYIKKEIIKLVFSSNTKFSAIC